VQVAIDLRQSYFIAIKFYFLSV